MNLPPTPRAHPRDPLPAPGPVPPPPRTRAEARGRESQARLLSPSPRCLTRPWLPGRLFDVRQTVSDLLTHTDTPPTSTQGRRPRLAALSSSRLGETGRGWEGITAGREASPQKPRPGQPRPGRQSPMPRSQRPGVAERWGQSLSCRREGQMLGVHMFPRDGGQGQTPPGVAASPLPTFTRGSLATAAS